MSDLDVLRILFVCSGNTCRSPLAAALARRDVDALGWSDRVRVSSAGTGAMEGGTASAGSLAAAESVGLDLSDHRSRGLTRELVEETDLILTMGMSHLVHVLDLGGDGKTSVIAAFAEGRDTGTGWSVPDPFGGDLAIYMETLRALELLIQHSLARLEPMLSNEADT